MTVRLMLVDDSVHVRKGLRLLLQTQHDFVVVAEACDGAAAVSLSRTLRPDVILMDLNMPGVNGLAATAAIMSDCPMSRVIILTVDDSDATRALAAEAGACGFIAKCAPPDDLWDIVRHANSRG